MTISCHLRLIPRSSPPGARTPVRTRAPVHPRECLHRLILAGALSLGLAGSGTVSAQTFPQITELDRIVAVVNDDIIAYSELDVRIDTVRQQLIDEGRAVPPESVLERQVLERLVLDRLQIQLAERRGLRINDEALNRAVAELARQNSLTVREFREILERDGFDFAKFREEIRAELLKRRLRQREVDERVQVTERDVDDFLATMQNQSGGTEYRLAHILIALPDPASPEQIATARTKGQRLLERLRNGEDFSELAVASSDGQQAFRGGDLGWRQAANIPSLFTDAVPGMRRGDVSSLIRSASGFHIIKLTDMRGGMDGGRTMTIQTHARHILLKLSAVLEADVALRRLSVLKERVLNGDDFAALARSHSEDTPTATKGGELGWINPGDVIPAFENAMNALSPGEISNPFATEFGWHIVQVLERREHDSTEDARRSQAAEQLRKRRTEEEFQSWLQLIRDEAYVEYRLEDE